MWFSSVSRSLLYTNTGFGGTDGTTLEFRLSCEGREACIGGVRGRWVGEGVLFFFILFWLHWVFGAVCRLPLVAVSGGSCLVALHAFSLWWLLFLLSVGSWAPVVVAHGLSCPMACGIFPDQGLNPCPLHWQMDP